MAKPVEPSRVGVNDLTTLAAELGLTAAPSGHGAYALVLQDGLRAEVFDEADIKNPPSFIDVCATELDTAIKAVCDHYEIDPIGTSFTVDPDTMRSRGVMIHTPSLLVTAIRCPTAAGGAGVPCAQDCSPHRPLTDSAPQ